MREEKDCFEYHHHCIFIKHSRLDRLDLMVSCMRNWCNRCPTFLTRETWQCARASKFEDTAPHDTRHTVFVSICHLILCHCVEVFIKDCQTPRTLRMACHQPTSSLHPPEWIRIPTKPEISTTHTFQPYQAPAITAPNIRKRVMDRIQPAPDSVGRSLPRGASAAERIVEDTQQR